MFSSTQSHKEVDPIFKEELIGALHRNIDGIIDGIFSTYNTTATKYIAKLVRHRNAFKEFSNNGDKEQLFYDPFVKLANGICDGAAVDTSMVFLNHSIKSVIGSNSKRRPDIVMATNHRTNEDWLDKDEFLLLVVPNNVNVAEICWIFV